MRKTIGLRCPGSLFVVALALQFDAVWARPQESAPGSQAVATELSGILQELQAQVEEFRATLQAVQAETVRLRRELEAARAQIASLPHQTLSQAAGPPAAEAPGRPTDQRLAKVEEEQELLRAKIDEQYQAKVESASKYRVRLSGIALVNLFENRGGVNSIDFPTIARRESEYSGSLGATLRQSELGLELFGPTVGGARTSAEIHLDLAGGFTQTLDGVNEGLLRLRTASMRFDWTHTSIIAGQDALFFSPLSPTSIATLAVPAFSYAGNLWTWTPQVRVEQRLNVSENSGILLQAGFLDPLDGETPEYQFLRAPQNGEASRQPAYAGRASWARRMFGRPFTIGTGGYYSRQAYSHGRRLDAWAATSDWSLPLGRLFEVSGEFYRGRAIGGLGAGIGRTVLYSGTLTDPTTTVLGLNDLGGWTQLKFKPGEGIEFNGAFGQDSSFARDVRRFSNAGNYSDASPVRNRSTLANVIIRPRSNLMFSLEFRRIRTFSIGGDDATANHINVGLGVLF